MKNILVTGGLGFIGSNFVNYMVNKYKEIKIIILDKKDYCASEENVLVNERVETFIGDIQNKELIMILLDRYNIDTIIHFAAQSHVDNSFFNSISFTINNILGTHVLLETARLYNEKTNALEKFIHVSTDEVYGEVTDDNPRTESCTFDPTNPYAATKASAELIAKSYYYSYKLPVIITRGNNVYGPNQYPEKVIPKFICSLLNGNKITIQGTGENRRNFIYVDDVCRAFDLILEKGKIGNIYNISADHSNEYKVIDLGKKLIQLIKGIEENEVDTYIEYIEDRKFNDYRYYISNNKLIELGWKPESVDFDKNLQELVEWYRINKKRYSM